MALSNRRYGRFTIPTGRYSDRQGTSGDLRELVKAYQPRNFGAEPPISTLSRVSATLADPYTGEPVKAGRTVYSNGTVGPGLTSVTEEGAGPFHVTKIDITGGTVAALGGAALGLGELIYTFPAGAIAVNQIHMNAGLTAPSTNAGVSTDQGIGSVIASGAVSVLGGTSTFEDGISGQTVTANGTLKNKAQAGSSYMGIRLIEAADAHTIYWNVAATWAGAETVTMKGTVWIHWTFLGNLK